MKNDISITRWEATEEEGGLPGGQGWGGGDGPSSSCLYYRFNGHHIERSSEVFSFSNQNFIMATILQVKVIKRWPFKSISYDEIASRLNLKKATAISRTFWLLNCFSTNNSLFFSHHL